MHRFTIGASTALGAGLLLAVAVPLSASAHVAVDPGSAVAGSYTVVTMKVPNESDTATTNRVTLTLPSDTPFSSVRYVPVAGWTAELVRTALPAPVTIGKSTVTEAVTSVTWTADPGSEIAAGQLQLFPLSVGPVPDVGSVVLPAEQGYTDGSVVDWNETTDDAAHPAPVLQVNDLPPADSHGSDAETAAEPVASSPGDQADHDILARSFGIAGLIVGVVGIVLAVTARRAAAK